MLEEQYSTEYSPLSASLETFIVKPEASFDSGYSTSPSRLNIGISDLNEKNNSLCRLPVMDHNKFIMSPVKSPLKTNTNSNAMGIMGISPLKTEPGLLSPFKDSSLSPFKLYNQSPSKGTVDDWENNFIATFEENLFGMTDMPGSVVDELLRSPQGKAFLESQHSPLRNNSAAFRRLKISPGSNLRKQNFQPLHDSSSEIFSESLIIKEEPIGVMVKTENTSHDHVYGQAAGFNMLSAIDPNKMSATPIKPRFTNVENAPIRKLSMPTAVGSFPNVVVHTGNIPVVGSMWPSKEKLKYARLQFREVLNRAVEKEMELIKNEKRKKAELLKRQNSKDLKNQCDSKSVVHTGGIVTKIAHKGGKVTKLGKLKGKVGRKPKRKDKYLQIKMALAKPVHQTEASPVIQRELFPPAGFTDPGWYPSDDEDEVEVDGDGSWSGPPPFFKQSGSGSYGDEEDSSDDDWTPSGYQYETLSGRRVKKRKIY